jgi:hypothetical protein
MSIGELLNFGRRMSLGAGMKDAIRILRHSCILLCRLVLTVCFVPLIRSYTGDTSMIVLNSEQSTRLTIMLFYLGYFNPATLLLHFCKVRVSFRPVWVNLAKPIACIIAYAPQSGPEKCLIVARSQKPKVLALHPVRPDFHRCI